MKKSIILSITFIIALGVRAQETVYRVIAVPVEDTYGKEREKKGLMETARLTKTNPVSFVQYQIEELSFYELLHCVPGSDVSFHPERSGGKLLKSITADKQGRAVLQSKQELNAAFAVNIKTKNKSGIKGNGMVDFAHEKIFVLKSISAEQDEQKQNTISWSAQSNMEEAAFVILKSTDNRIYTPVQTIALKKNADLATFSYKDATGGTASYIIQVVNKTDNTAYNSRTLQVGVSPSIAQVYPSPVTDQLTIMLTDKSMRGEYQVLDNAGKIVQAGKLSEGASKIDVSKLAKGSYFIKVTTLDKRSETKQFMKK